jgi:hypothetical protein
MAEIQIWLYAQKELIDDKAPTDYRELRDTFFSL